MLPIHWVARTILQGKVLLKGPCTSPDAVCDWDTIPLLTRVTIEAPVQIEERATGFLVQKNSNLDENFFHRFQGEGKLYFPELGMIYSGKFDKGVSTEVPLFYRAVLLIPL